MHETQDVKVSCATFLFRQTREKQYGDDTLVWDHLKSIFRRIYILWQRSLFTNLNEIENISCKFLS